MPRPSSLQPGDPLATVALHSLYAMGGLLGLSLGMLNPVISILLEHRGTDGLLIGANASLFFLCVAALAPLVGRQLRLAGLRRTLAAGLAAYAAAAALFPWQEAALPWFALRGLMGLGMACAMIGAQTGLSVLAGPERRAWVNGVYGLCFGVGLALGPLLGAYLYGLADYLPFLAAGLFLLQGAGLALLGLPAARLEAGRPAAGTLWRTGIPALAVLAYGFAEATLLTIYPAYLVRGGLAPVEVGHRLGIFVLGGLLGTLPLSLLGDRLGHRQVLLGCAVGGMLALGCAAGAEGVGDLLNRAWAQAGLIGSPVGREAVEFVAAFVVGFMLGPVFGLALAMLADLLPPAELSAGAALFTAAFSLGSAAGPGFTAWIMSRLGEHHLFSGSLALFGLLGLAQCAAWLRGLLGGGRNDYAEDHG